MNYKEWVIKISEQMSNEEFVSELAKIRPDIEPLEEFQGMSQNIKCHCKKCGDIFYTKPSTLLKSRAKSGNGCKNCTGTKKKTQDKYIADLKAKGLNIIPLEEYKNSNTSILHKCLICGCEWSVRPANLLSGNSHCPCCYGRRVVEGYNDLATTHPEIAKWVKNPEDAKKFSHGSRKKIDWICPNCGAEVKQKAISDVVYNGKVPCKQCADGVSYPMKFVVNMFEQLDVPITTENLYDWCHFEINGVMHRGFYDIAFQNNGDNYIVEVDGGFHFIDSSLSGQSKEKSQYLDKEKQRLAEENGYHVIRIEARKSTINYMKNSLLNSELASIYDLSIIDWNKCGVAATSSLAVECANLWNEYHSANAVAKALGRKQNSVVRYLNQARDAGLCDYDGHTEHIKSGLRNVHLAWEAKRRNFQKAAG